MRKTCRKINRINKMQLYQLKFPNSKSYIGITTGTAQERFKRHCKPSQNKNPCQRAIHKYGKENVIITVLAECDNLELLLLAEMEAIEKHETFGEKGYNLTLGGEGVLTLGIYGEERIDRDKKIKAAYNKLYFESNKSKLIADKKIYNSENKERIKDRVKVYREKNKERIATYYKEHNKANKDKISEKNKAYREKNKEYMSEYRAVNKEKIAIARKAYREKNKPSG